MDAIRLLVYVLFFGPYESTSTIKEAADDTGSADIGELVFSYLSLLFYGAFVGSISFPFLIEMRWWVPLIPVGLWLLSSLCGFMIFAVPFIVTQFCGKGDDEEEFGWAR